MNVGAKLLATLFNSLLLVCFISSANGQINVTFGSDIIINSGGYQVSVGEGRLVNNGVYTDTVGAFNILGGVTLSGAGTTTLNQLNINNTGSTIFNSLVSVNRTTHLIAGNFNANNNLFVRSDRSLSANLLVSGVLNGNVQGLITRPTVAIAPCPSFSTDLSLNVAGPVMAYQWQNSNDSVAWSDVAGATSSVYSPLVTSDIYYRCKLTTTNSAYSQYTPGVSLRLTGVPLPVSVSGDGPHCAQVTLDATGGSGGIIYYQGSSSDDTSTTYPKDTALVTASGIYFFRARSVAGCWGPQDSAIVTINPRLTPGVIYTIDPGTHICQGVRTTFTASPINGGSTPSYTWLVNGVNTGVTDSVLTYIPTERDRVKIILTTSATCVTTTTAIATANMTVDTNYIPIINIVAKPDFPFSKGGYDTLIAEVSGAGPLPTYQWYKNGSAAPGATTSIYISNEFREGDSVSCVVVGSGFCSWPSFNSLIVRMNTVGLNNAQFIGNLGIYPNPNNGTFTIKGAIKNMVSGEVRLSVANVLGQYIVDRTAPVKDNRLDETVDLGDIPNGNYILTIETDGERATYRLVVHK